jgi:aspartate dehydrogenase
MKTVGVIGTGNIATLVFKTARNIKVEKLCVYDINQHNLEKFCKKFHYKKIHRCKSIEEVIKFSDIVLEVASISAVEEIFKFIKFYKDKVYIFLSVGGILKNFLQYKYLIKNGYKIYIPSGAIAGCDALSAVKYTRIKSIQLKTIKPLKTLITSPYFEQNKNLYNKILKQKQTVIFHGNVYNAVKNFPQSINVAATLAIVSNNPNKVKVTIVADKNLKYNIHEVTIISTAGKIFTRTENIPSEDNPKTSYLSALSALSVLHQYV